MAMCRLMIRKPVQNRARAERVLRDHVYALTDTYEMRKGEQVASAGAPP